MIVWPADLPQHVLATDFTAGSREGRLATQTDVGPGKTRRRSSAAVRPVSATVIVDWDGRMRFERFWDEETQGGVLPFLIRDQLVDDLPLTSEHRTLYGDDGAMLLIQTYWLVQFDIEQKPAWSVIGGGPHLQVRFGLKVLP